MAEDEVVIKLRNIRKTYGKGSAATSVLRGISFDVKAGEFIALVGQSGSGKSTLLNIIGGLDAADSGDVHVLGHHYNKISERRLAKLRNADIGFVFQHFNLLDHLTCAGNVTLPAVFSPEVTNAQERGEECLERVGLKEYCHRTPAELSGGQKQRVAIARALFNKPRLMLCDEPTGNLDTSTGREVIDFFRQINDEDGVSLMIVTHERRVSSVASRVLTISDGDLVEGGDVDDVGATVPVKAEHGDDAPAVAATGAVEST